MPQRDHLLCRQCTNGHDRVTIVAMQRWTNHVIFIWSYWFKSSVMAQHQGGRSASFYHPMNKAGMLQRS
jgi:hypothetical protein